MLVFYHVVGGDSAQGLRVQEGVYRLLADGLAFARMPVFAALAGYTYSFSRQAGWGLIRKKARRLLLPTLVVGTLFAAMRAVVGGSGDVAESEAYWHWLPVGHFWFLQSLFLIFVGVFILERWIGLSSSRICLAVFLVSCVAYLQGIATPVLGIAGAFYLAPFFFFGLLTARMRQEIGAWLGKWWWVLLLVLVFTATVSFSFEQRDNVFHLLSGVMVSALSMQFMPRLGLLERVGRYSFEIFLFHVFFTAGARSLLQFCGVIDRELLVLGGMLCGIWGPMMVSRVCRPFAFYRVLVLGQDNVEKTLKKRQ